MQAKAWPSVRYDSGMARVPRASRGSEVKESRVVRCSDTLRWNGYRQDHALGGDIEIQSDQEKRRHVNFVNYGECDQRTSTDASGKMSVWL